MARSCSVDACSNASHARGVCKTHYSRLRRNGDLALRQAPNGAGCVDQQGYRQFRVDGRMQREHRVVMERMLGRPLLRSETVHHINGDRLDNRPENLELWSSFQPAGQRVADKVAWAREILARYSDQELSCT